MSISDTVTAVFVLDRIYQNCVPPHDFKSYIEIMNPSIITTPPENPDIVDFEDIQLSPVPSPPPEPSYERLCWPEKRENLLKLLKIKYESNLDFDDQEIMEIQNSFLARFPSRIVSSSVQPPSEFMPFIRRAPFHVKYT